MTLAVVLLVAPATSTAQQEGDVTIGQDGWWNRAVGPQEAEPAGTKPLRDVTGPLVPGPATVPASALGVGAQSGQPDKVAAIGIAIPASTGATIGRLTLTLKETGGATANPNSSGAAMIACPIVDFWAGARNAQFVDRPKADCAKVSGKGTRSPDGTWAFDLVQIARQWVDAGSGLTQNGILLVENVDAPGSFQVSFEDASKQPYTIEYAATENVDQVAAPASPPPAAGGSSPTPAFTPAPSSGGSFVAEPAPLPDVAVAADPVPEPGAALAPAPAPAGRSAPPGTFDGIPWALLVLCGALALALAGVVLKVLGPDGRPTPVLTRRLGGVGRALDTRSRS